MSLYHNRQGRYSNSIDADVANIVPGGVGELILGVRNDAGGSLVSNDQEFTAAQFDSSGRLRVVTQGGAGGTSSIDDAVFTAGVDSGTPAMGFFSTDIVNSGDVGVLAMDTSRRLMVSIEVDNVGIGGGTQYAVDTALGATPTGTLMVAIRDDVLTALTPIEGDAIGLRVGSTGALWTNEINSAAILADTASMDTNLAVIAGDTTSIDGKITACNTDAVVISSGTITAVTDITNVVSIDDNGGSLTVDGTVGISGIVTVDLAGNNDVTVTGNVAHDAVDSGAPVKTGSKAVLFNGTAPPNAAVAEDDRVNDIADEYGRKYVETAHPNYWSVSVDYTVAQTNATVKAAPGVGLKLYITDIMCSNGATAGNITLLDGSGGAVLWELYPAVNGGAVDNRRHPIVLTANTLLAITSTTVTTHSLTISGFIAP